MVKEVKDSGPLIPGKSIETVETSHLIPEKGNLNGCFFLTQGRTISVGCQRSGLPISNMCQAHGSKLFSKEIGVRQLAPALVSHDWESSAVLTTKQSC